MNFAKIGIFYDGNYFLQASNYYAYGHNKRKRLSVAGLHAFIRNQVAKEENLNIGSSKIVDAHYFRGRLNAYDASLRGDLLFWDRAFDDILIAEGVTTHYVQIKPCLEGTKPEKDIEIQLVLEAYEMAVIKKLDLVVLVAGDGEYLPLVRKLHSLGTRVMVLGWEAEYVNENNNRITIRTSQELLDEASYPVLMHHIIDSVDAKSNPLVENLFVASDSKKIIAIEQAEIGLGKRGEILNLRNGFGFIKYPPNNVFFHFSNLADTDFQDLQPGDQVLFDLEKGDEGQDVAKNVRLLIAHQQ